MAYCPIISYQRMNDPSARRTCMGKDCALYDEVAGGCLIRTYLISQIGKSNVIIEPVNPPPAAELTTLEQKVEKLEKDVKYAGLGFPLDTFFGGSTK